MRSSELHDRATAADEVMRRVYRSFVEAPRARGGVRAAAPAHRGRATRAALFHCTAGKDRTGWAAALLLHLAGVDDATILEDYLLTNSFSSATREKYLGLVREHLGADKVDGLRAGDGRRRGLPPGRRTTPSPRRTATGDGYLRDGLGLDDRLLARLRDRMLA